MLKNQLPEEAGISSKYVSKFISSLEKRGIHMHSLLLMRGDRIFLECYWATFHKDFGHRIYSATKSFVSVAIGLAEEDGLIDLDDAIASYFPEKIDGPLCTSLRKQTIRETLTMTTAGNPRSWFEAGDPDRTHLYFKDRGECRPAGTAWAYDSAGSQLLCALVEKVTGKTLFAYLNERIFREIDAFHHARILKTPNGESWGDSAMICTSRDLAAFARFVMNYGTYDGKRLMNEQYLRTATSRVVDNVQDAHGGVFRHGYGYQFWITEENAFAFKGMGAQLAICHPEKDLIMVCTGDTQGNAFAVDYIAAQFFDLIAANVCDTPLPADEQAWKALCTLTGSLKLYAVKGAEDSAVRKTIDGTVYECNGNPLGWKEFSFRFDGADKGELIYTNESGRKSIPFFVNANRFGKFPEEGYSGEIGGMRTTDGSKYDDAVSFAWLRENKLLLFVQIIDRYFGNLSLIFSFKEDMAVVNASKTAEDFLWNYKGEIVAKRRE